MLKRLWRWMFGESRLNALLKQHDEAVDDLESTTQVLMTMNREKIVTVFDPKWLVCLSEDRTAVESVLHGGYDTMDGEG